MTDEETSRRTFELLANETRLGIISALGEASGEGGYATLAFSEIQEAVGVEDNGQFNYHLKQLLDEFVEQKQGGYGLTLAGIRAYQALIAQQFNTETTVEAFAIDGSCETCGERRYAWYDDGRAHIGCRECGDLLYRYPVAPSTFDPATPESLLQATNDRLTRDRVSMLKGLCPYCAGAVTNSLQPPDDYWEETNMLPDEVLVHSVCDRCAWFLYSTVGGMIEYLPVVSGFLADRGFDPWKRPLWEMGVSWELEAYDLDAPTVWGRFEIAGDRLTVTVDGELDVIEAVERADDASE
ncbi:helix-turn-helix domain-containing protein [Halobaculum sp. CBA1158]|uniref:winged helix-turn-helix domain-containing protein n=1 Tax=Halobaculum sp. CBA1158 TaxID=2904243 RepID=UPI001F3E40D8|nr:helix-turn-helix domain-containing protein [Halobaculum sp. CBA1158]UIP00968.1 helix-turn-helix domain-containing protein [Halobaculum sp. CBA1158]